MKSKEGFQDHWLNIDPERMERYETMYRWNPATAAFYDAARLAPGQAIGDFGCGPGFAAIEFAKLTGPSGLVHAFDINDEFVARARARARAEGLEDRIAVHLLESADLPLPDRSLDRMVVRNTLIYVADPVESLREFRRCLRPGGLVHAIESDWRLTAVEPVSREDWSALIEAASWAWPRPEMGRMLFGCARRAGFEEVAVQVLTSPDTTGRLMGMIRTVAGYAKDSDAIDRGRVEKILEDIDGALAKGTYLAIAPQFIVTATVPAQKNDRPRPDPS